MTATLWSLASTIGIYQTLHDLYLGHHIIQSGWNPCKDKGFSCPMRLPLGFETLPHTEATKADTTGSTQHSLTSFSGSCSNLKSHIIAHLLDFHDLWGCVLRESNTQSADWTSAHTVFHIVVPQSPCLLSKGTWSTPAPQATIPNRAAWNSKCFAHLRSTSASIDGTHTDGNGQCSN
jgi:hypothetical protein